MRIFTLNSRVYLPGCPSSTNPIAGILAPVKAKSRSQHPIIPYIIKATGMPGKTLACPTEKIFKTKHTGKPSISEFIASKGKFLQVSPDGYTRFVILGAASLGLALLLMGMDDQKALALGPEGPLVEEFWDNVRRYALYALTVSTGALYTVFQPIVELLKNPISAVLILIIFAGSIYIVSQVLYAMVGVSDFSYDYGY
uniref:Uncharacterized protein ycf33 n=1 Tax=Rhizophora mucronata TaxID=61149 RepID=A0A2P2MEP7_RHIMU